MHSMNKPSPSLMELVFPMGRLTEKSVRCQDGASRRKKAEVFGECQVLSREVRESSRRTEDACVTEHQEGREGGLEVWEKQRKGLG